MLGSGNAEAPRGDAMSEAQRQELPPRTDIGTLTLHLSLIHISEPTRPY